MNVKKGKWRVGFVERKKGGSENREKIVRISSV